MRALSHSGKSSTTYIHLSGPDPHTTTKGADTVLGCLHVRPYLSSLAHSAPQLFRHVASCPTSQHQDPHQVVCYGCVLWLVMPCHGHQGWGRGV